jgi:hypothetical protein
MSWTVVLFSVCGGALATYFVARATKHHQPKKVEPPPAPPAPSKIEVDVVIRPAGFFSAPGSLGLANCGCEECLAAELEFAAMKEEYQQIMKQFDASRSASTEVDPRRLEYVRYLVQTKRLSDYF